ncbi:asparaginase [Comamonas sp. B-9]|uniref:asparaginase n=1 Tax=Comamonas sp. B-9 TaxID=1055192 RepID=UPI00041B15EA|nr:asparaginase [Comamonas sp. B-9]
MQPKILIIGTGGTIAGMADDAEKPGQYRAAQLSIAALLAGVSGIETAAAGPLDAVQIAQIDSKDMNDEVWHALLKRCDAAMRDETVRAVVITHGTDTLEETAWFLHCVLGRLAKPVVLTCAMRPANALMPDGPQNLKDAVAAAAALDADGQPLLREVVAVTGGGELHSARWLQKVHPHRLLAFSSGEQGPLGWVDGVTVRLRQGYAPQAPGTADGYSGSQWLAALPVPASQPWPWVEIVTSHAGLRPGLVEALQAQGIDGLVVATTGNGTVHQVLLEAIARARQQGLPVWRSSRCSDGVISDAVLPGAADLEKDLAVALTPYKCRVSLQLALLQAQTKAKG